MSRDLHPFPTSTGIVNQICSDYKVFVALDELKGCFQIPVDEESSFNNFAPRWQISL